MASAAPGWQNTAASSSVSQDGLQGIGAGSAAGMAWLGAATAVLKIGPGLASVSGMAPSSGANSWLPGTAADLFGYTFTGGPFTWTVSTEDSATGGMK